MLFGLTLIAVIAAKDTLKGLIAGLFGLLIGVIGTDHIYGTPRAHLRLPRAATTACRWCRR